MPTWEGALLFVGQYGNLIGDESRGGQVRSFEAMGGPKTLYRGLPISPDRSTANRIQELFDAGDFISVSDELMRLVDRATGAGTSWTKREGVAVRFALSNDSWLPPGTFAVVLVGEWAGNEIDYSRDRPDDNPDQYEQYEDEVRLHTGDQVHVTEISFRAPSTDIENYFESLKWTTVPVSRTLTAQVNVSLQNLLEECKNSDSSGSDYANVQAFLDLPESALDTHPRADHLKSLQEEAKGYETPGEDMALVEELARLADSGKHSARTAADNYTVFLRDIDGNNLALDNDYDAVNKFKFSDVITTRDFIAEHAGKLGYWINDDMVIHETLIMDFKAIQNNRDVTDEFKTLDKLWNFFGSRTAAEPGGVLPWTPSHRGYYWITKTDGTLEAVTNDGVNRMFLYDKPWGWEWEVYDSIGLVESGNFGSALKGGDALRDRANDLLAEFDTRNERRTRGPSRGYQDDYTQAPNTLWSKREALYHETGNSDGVAIVLTFPMEYREALALPEGTPADELHITLGYFGSVDEQDPDSEDDLRQACEYTATLFNPFTVSLGGLIRFSGEDQDAFVLNADSAEIDNIRSILLDRLDAMGRIPDKTHGFTPHCTLGYLNLDDSLPMDRWEPIKVPVVAVELWYGEDSYVYPFGGPQMESRKTTSQRYAERLCREGRS